MCALAGAPAAADELQLRPSVELKTTFTDNVRSTPGNQLFDVIFDASAQIEAQYESERTRFLLDFDLTGEKYLREAELDNLTSSGFGAGTVKLLRELFAVDGNFVIDDTFIDQDARGATDRRTGADVVRVNYWDVSPYLTLDVLGWVDLLARYRYAELSFDQASGFFFVIPPEDTIIQQGIVQLTTAPRQDWYVVQVVGEYTKDDLGFEQVNGVASVFIEVTPRILQIGRVGWENIKQDGLIDIEGMIWSSGLRFQFSPDSYIQAEIGERFDRTSWSGEAVFKLTPRVTFTSQYVEAVETQQLRLARTFGDLLGGTEPPPPGSGINLTEDLRDVISLFRDLDFRLGYDDKTTAFEIVGGYAERSFFNGLSDETRVSLSSKMSRQMTRDLEASYEVQYFETVSLPTAEVESELWVSTLRLEYTLIKDVTVTGEYIWQKRFLDNGVGIPENAIVFGVTRDF